MKLRNKKTGEITELGGIRQYWREEKDGGMGYLFQKVGDNKGSVYNSLAELNEEWEDYKPTEPLIKDEKIRNVVRAWAEVNGIDEVAYVASGNSFGRFGYVIRFDYDFVLNDGLADAHFYTIAELCGEGEE